MDPLASTKTRPTNASVRPHVAVVDTGSGNLRSVQKALEVAGAFAQVTADPDLIAKADKVLVPGQGAFGACMLGLCRDGGALEQVVREAIMRGIPYFGVCLGLQVLFESSDESPNVAGLGLIPGKVVKFNLPAPLKVPHMGWNPCTPGPAYGVSSILSTTPAQTSFYFVHSYFAAPTDPNVVALQSDHGIKFCAAIARDNIFACQFHPEKSQKAGLDLLRQFVAL